MELTDEQKQTIILEVAHYLAMDCYDFIVSVGGVTIIGGEFVGKICEAK